MLCLAPSLSVAQTGFGTNKGFGSIEGFVTNLGFDSNGGFGVPPPWLSGPVPGPTIIDVDEVGSVSAGIEEAILATCPTDPNDPAGVVLMPVGTTVTIDMTLDNAAALLDPNIDVPNLANCEIVLTGSTITWLYTQEDADNVAGNDPQLRFVRFNTWTNVQFTGGTHIFENTCKTVTSNGVTQPFGDDTCFGGNIRAFEGVNGSDVRFRDVHMIGPFTGNSDSTSQWRSLIYATGVDDIEITNSTFEVGNSGIAIFDFDGLNISNNFFTGPDVSTYGGYGGFHFDGTNDTAFTNHPKRMVALGTGSNAVVEHNTFDGAWGSSNIELDIAYVSDTSSIFRVNGFQVGFGDVAPHIQNMVRDSVFSHNTVTGLTRNIDQLRFFYVRGSVDNTFTFNSLDLDAGNTAVGIMSLIHMPPFNANTGEAANTGNVFSFNTADDISSASDATCRGTTPCCAIRIAIGPIANPFGSTSNQSNIFEGNSGDPGDTTSIYCGSNATGGEGGVEDGISYVRNEFRGTNGSPSVPISPTAAIVWGSDERGLNGLTTTPRTGIPYYWAGGTHENISAGQDEVLNHNSDLAGTPAVDGENWTLTSRGGATELKYCPPAANTIVHDGASAGECIVSTGTNSTISLIVQGAQILVTSGGAGWSQETP